ncbi:bacteriocin [Legionella hackeliae]|uniref:Uncharacterized protein n=1 Tax=Legionella hackeliae TaxID=449 RepID=A0A0A8USJ9_LEGHA|nr:bacteriocin [Legionella hackeliae]KTD10544.1 hypothetical protein Lhac_2912 [Legionella hackeliae]CEK10047.1 protein of unknown function [Legionella hackeliae]STX46773.1 Uncharacterised protein [Legionella hackeliae]
MKKSIKFPQKNPKKISNDKLNNVSGGRTGEYMDEIIRKQNETGITPPKKEI